MTYSDEYADGDNLVKETRYSGIYHRLLQDHSDKQNILAELLAELADRLSPVMNTSTKDPGVETKASLLTNPNGPATSALSGQLMGYTEGVVKMTNRVREILERLEV